MCSASHALVVICVYFIVAVPLTCGEDLRVGVYSGVGQEGILEGLAGRDGIEASSLDNLGAFALSNCDVVVWPHAALQSDDRARPWRVLVTEYVRRGGGLVLTHIGAGGFRGINKDDPLFPRIAVNADRREFLTLHKLDGLDHPIAAASPTAVRHAYYDHMIMRPGPDGTVLFVDKEKNPVVIAGRVGRGRVVIMGNLPGFKGTKTDGAIVGEKVIKDEGPTKLEGDELALVVAALRWGGEPLHAHPVLPSELETDLDAAVDEAIAAGAQRTQPVRVFGTEIVGNYLDTALWDYAPSGPGTNKWGAWYGHGIVGPPYNMFLETFAVNQPLTSQRFERSPVTGKYVFTGEAVLSGMFAGILEWRLRGRLRP